MNLVSMSMARKVVLAGAAFSVGYCLWCADGTSPDRAERPAGVDSRLEPLVETPGAAAEASFGKPLLLSEDLHVKAVYESGGNGVSFWYSERDPNTGQFVLTKRSFATSFGVVDVYNRGSHEFFVLGRARNGDDVFEHWQLPEVIGERVARRPSSQAPVGVAVEPVPTYLTWSGEGGFIPSSERSPAGPGTRNELYRGSSFGGVIAFEVDPEGRFLMVLAADRTLYQLRLDGVPTIVPLYTPADVDGLDAMGEIFPLQHITQGRIWELNMGGPNLPLIDEPKTILIYDATNDGVPDLALDYTHAEYVDQGYAGDVWTDDFLNY